MTTNGEDELQANQDGRVYPVGQALRATYGADNHDTLGNDVTGLMIDLSKIPYDAEERAMMAAAGLRRAQEPVEPPSWFVRLGAWLGGRWSASSPRTR